MAKKKRHKIKKHIFIPDDTTQDPDFFLMGIQTQESLYRLVYDFNRHFNLGFTLQEPLHVLRKNREISFENYATVENALGQKSRLLNNLVLVPIPHPDTLFDTHEAYYLFPELPSLDYLLMMPAGDLDFTFIQQNFRTHYPLTIIAVDMTKCATAFPVFPG